MKELRSSVQCLERRLWEKGQRTVANTPFFAALETLFRAPAFQQRPWVLDC